MKSKGMRQYNDYNDLMDLATPDAPPDTEELDPSPFIDEVNPMDYAEGNDPNELQFANGGVVPNMGGMRRAPNGSTDTVPAMLTPHEYVIPQDVVLKKGTDFFDKIRDEARGMGKKGKGEAAPTPAPAPQAVPGPQGEMRQGLAGGGTPRWPESTISQETKDLIWGGMKRAGNDFVEGVKGLGNNLVEGAKALPGAIVNQVKSDYSQPVADVPYTPEVVSKVANAVINPVARTFGMNTDPNTGPTKPPGDWDGYNDAQKRIADIKANPGNYPQPANAWGFDPAKRFTETPTGAGMSRKMITPEYNDYLNKGGKPIVVGDEGVMPIDNKLEVIPAGMSREQFNQNKLFDQYKGYAQQEQDMAAKAADADYKRMMANSYDQTTTRVVPLGEGAFASYQDVEKKIPGLINTATVKPNDFMSQQNTLAKNQLDNLTDLQKEAMKEQRDVAKAGNEEARKTFAGLDEVILGGWNKTKGEVVPGIYKPGTVFGSDGSQDAANYFKTALSSTGVPSSVFQNYAIVMPPEGSNIMTIYDPKNPNGPKLSGTPSELARQIHSDYFSQNR